MPKMSPELEAIMDRRRRRADGVASPSLGEGDPTTGTTTDRGRGPSSEAASAGGRTRHGGGGVSSSSRRQIFPRSTPPVAVSSDPHPHPPAPPPDSTGRTPSPRSSPPPPAYRFQPISKTNSSPRPPSPGVGPGVGTGTSPSPSGAFFRKKIASSAPQQTSGGRGTAARDERDRERHVQPQKVTSTPSPLRASDAILQRRLFVSRSSAHHREGGEGAGPAQPVSTDDVTGRGERYHEGRRRVDRGGDDDDSTSSSDYEDDVEEERTDDPYQEDYHYDYDYEDGSTGGGEWEDYDHGGVTAASAAASAASATTSGTHGGDVVDYYHHDGPHDERKEGDDGSYDAYEDDDDRFRRDDDPGNNAAPDRTTDDDESSSDEEDGDDGEEHVDGGDGAAPPGRAGVDGRDVVARNDEDEDRGSTFFPSNFSEFTTTTTAPFDAFGEVKEDDDGQQLNTQSWGFPAFDGSRGEEGEGAHDPSGRSTDAFFGGGGADFAPFPSFGEQQEGRPKTRGEDDDDDDGVAVDGDISERYPSAAGGYGGSSDGGEDDSSSSHSSAPPPADERAGQMDDEGEKDVHHPASDGDGTGSGGDDPSAASAAALPPPPPPQSPAPRSATAGTTTPSSAGGGKNEVVGNRNRITLRSRRLPIPGSSDGLPSPPPLVCTNPITGNVILCHARGGHWAVDEIRPVDGGGVVASIPILTAELQRRLVQRGRAAGHLRRGGGRGVEEGDGGAAAAGGGGGACLSVAAVVGFAVGVHRQGRGGARVKVAALVDLNPFPTGGGGGITPADDRHPHRRLRRVVLVWQWGHDVGRSVALQSVISPPSSGSDGEYNYDPSTLCVADGLLFLGGSTVALPCVHIAKPHVRDGWSTVVVGGQEIDKTKKDGKAVTVTALAVTSQPGRSNKYLAVATSDGSLSVWTYELAASTNRMNREQSGGSTKLLKPLCSLVGARAFADAEESIFVDDGRIAALTTEDDPPSLSASSADKPVDNSYCTHLAWNPPGLSSSSCGGSSSLVMLAAAFTNGMAVYHVALPIVASVSTPSGTAADSMSELSGGGASTASDENNPSAAAITSSKTTKKKDKKKTIRGFSITGGKGNKNSSSRDRQQQQPSPANPAADANRARSSPLEEAVSLSPIVVARASNSGLIHRDGQSCKPKWTRVAWLDLGPRCPPCLALLFGSGGSVSKRRDDNASDGSGMKKYVLLSSRIVVGAVRLPLYGYPILDDEVMNRRPLAFTTLCEVDIAPPPPELGDHPSRFALAGVPVAGAIACPSDEGLALFSPAISSPTTTTTTEGENTSFGGIDDAYFSSLSRPISSRPLGVDSRGVGLPEDGSDDGAVLHVFSQLVCRRRDVPSTTTESSAAAAGERYDFDFPVQRHWLCCTTVNDRGRQKQNNTRNNVGDDAVATAGARTAVVCELTCGESSSKGLTPHRIVRSHRHSGTAGFAAVLFSSTLGASSTTITTEPIAYAIFNLSHAATKKTFKLRHGRDLTFVSLDAKSNNREVGRLVAISADGRTVYEMIATTEKDVPSGGGDSIAWNKHGLVKLKLGENFDARRVFSPFAGSSRLVLAATCLGSRRSCLFLGEDVTASSNNWGKNQKMDRWSKMARLLPRKQSPKLWLRVGEEVVSIAQLPDTGQRASSSCLAVATQARVMMVSSTSLTVITELDTSLMCDTLAPVGSRCVSFCSTVPSGGRSLAKIRYLSCLRDTGGHSGTGGAGRGVIATLPNPRFGHAPSLFLALCPDRLVYLSSHGASMLSERNEAEDAVLLPMAVTRPAMLLEPLVANALCLGDDGVGGGCGSDAVQFTLRCVIDRFGRKSSSFPHGECEGISLQGSGLTGNVYKMLADHGCSEANSFILTGNSPYDANTRDNILPKWISMTSKAEATNKGTSLKQVLVAGDLHLAGYVNDPEASISATLYRANDPSSLLSYEYAVDALLRGNISDAVRLFDLSGSERAERTIVDLLLSRDLKPNCATKDLLKKLCGDGRGGGSASDFCAPGSAMAALVLDLKRRQVKGKVPVDAGECEKIHDSLANEWMRQLAPSVQRCRSTKRVRTCLFGETGIASAVGESDEEKEANPIWKDPSNNSKHVWCHGPQGDRESILMLDRIEEWLGRCRPVVLGSEGAAAAEETGTKTLADILSAAATEIQDDELSTGGGPIWRDGWVEGVGEGRQDEDNLSAYYRFSEGADEDNGWITDGLKDLSSYNNYASIVSSEMITLEATTSSVDEGEAGKVSLLYDVVFNDRCERDQIGGMVLDAPRGSSLDVGILHYPQHDSRQRCTIEFWFCLPIAEQVQDEIVLARRSIGSGKDNSNLCCPSANETALWELVLLPEGFLQFRSSGGTVLTTTPDDEPRSDEVAPSATVDSDDNSTIEAGVVSWGRDSGGGGWNHACLVLSSRSQRAVTDCEVQIIMRGEIAASSIVSIAVPDIDGRHATDESHIDKAMQNTALMFGLGAVKGFRMTEVRVWSCTRKLDDVKMMMHEYLAAAESKKKFKVKIRNRVKTKPGGVGGLLAPNKGGAVLLSEPPGGQKSSRLPPPGLKSRRSRDISGGGSPIVAGTSSSALEAGGGVDFAASFEEHNISTESVERKDIGVIKEKEKEKDVFAFKNDFFGESSNSFEDISSSWGFPGSSKGANPDHSADTDTPVGLSSSEMPFFESKGSTRDAFGVETGFADSAANPLARVSAGAEQAEVFDVEQERNIESSVQSPEEEGVESDSDSSSIQSLYLDASVPLSQEVRTSVAAALIRGPPAARHFGGNRGGLLCSSTTGYDRAQRSNSVAICGAEKTVIYTFGHSPPGKTYPIGASGAIASDAVDENGSQYLCCFHAQEKKLLVLDLKNKIMVVELKMTTKLNFWRCLPNEVHGGTVVFLLITPIGAFHWLPLDKDPSPRLVWKRSDELQGKKIIAYEEGGNNGSPDSLSRSTIALLMVPSSVEPESVEAWCLPLNRDASPFHYGQNVVCTSFCRPPKLGQDGASFYPLVCIVLWERNVDDDGPHVAKMKMMIETISQYSYERSVSRGVVLASTTLDLDENMLTADLPQPTLAMGTLPVVLLLCFEDIIVVILRKQGIILVYNYDNGSLTLIGRKSVGQFVVDASIRPGEVEGEVEVLLLLCNPLNTKDGRTAVLQLSRIGYML